MPFVLLLSPRIRRPAAAAAAAIVVDVVVDVDVVSIVVVVVVEPSSSIGSLLVTDCTSTESSVFERKREKTRGDIHVDHEAGRLFASGVATREDVVVTTFFEAVNGE